MKIDDGKHFLGVILHDQTIRGEIICKADPESDESAACRLTVHRPEDSRVTCLVKDQWENLGLDMLMKAPGVDDKIGFSVTEYPVPVVYESYGGGDDYEDWVFPKAPA